MTQYTLEIPQYPEKYSSATKQYFTALEHTWNTPMGI